MQRLSSLSTEGLSVRISTEFSPAHRATFSGRATVVVESGDFQGRSYPTAAEMRALAGALLTAAAQVELPPVEA